MKKAGTRLEQAASAAGTVSPARQGDQWQQLLGALLLKLLFKVFSYHSTFHELFP